MRPTFGYNIMMFTVITLLLGCNTETAIKDQQPDPVLVEYPVVYIERNLTAVDQTPAQFQSLNPAYFNPGAQLLIKRNAFADSPATNLTAALFAEDQLIDIRDLSVSDDGQQLLMAIRAPEIDGVDDDEQPKWNIWRYTVASQTLERIITSDITAEQGNDLMPAFLPDGRIIFASTRQRLSRAILLDEGKPQYTALDESRTNETFNIHIMDPDGSAIKQLTFNLSHDLYPLVLQSGKILYSRWDRMGGGHGINLYRMNPDGTENELVFGWHSHQLPLDGQTESIDFIKPQQLASGEILMLLASQDDTRIQKRPVLINIDDYIDAQQATANSGAQGEAITDATLSEFNFSFSAALSENGRINHLYPLPDNSQRFLMSWDLCRVVVNDIVRACGQLTAEQLADDNLIQADPLYELWLLNNANNTQQLVATTSQGTVLTESVVMQPSAQPKTFIADKVVGNELDSQLSQELAGSIHIRSVYDFDGIDTTANVGGISRLSDPSQTPAANLPARFLRIVRGVPMPPDDVRDILNTDFGRSNNQLMREIVGYSPIQPDGSVKIKVPANVPLAISVLDINGQRIGGRHSQWITLTPGENLECTGCHTANSQLPHSDSIKYQDIWTNPVLSAVNPNIEYSYSNLATPAPNGSECFENWTPYCRIQINYVEHIQPLWDLARPVIDATTQMIVADNTCTSCHNIVDVDGAAQVPAGQLSLINSPSGDQAAHLTSYRELLFNDVEQEEVDGILIDKLVEVLDADGNVVYQVDSNGELILDADGNPIPVLTTVNVPAVLSTNGARSSSTFFEVMSNTTHQNMLSADELKLLNEWLDIGAQYYNTPFYSQD